MNNKKRKVDKEYSKRSEIWNHFTDLGDRRAICTHCECSYSHNAPSTTNLWKHLKAKHPNLSSTYQLSSTQKKIKKIKIDNTSPKKNDISNSNEVDEMSIIVMESIEKEEEPFLQTKILPLTIKHSQTEQKTYDTLLFEMIYKDYLSFRIVEDEGFINFVQALDPSYELPNRLRLIKMLSAEYNLARKSFKNLFDDVGVVNLTTDCWSNHISDSYVSISAHFLDKKWVLHSIFLSTLKVSEHHNAEVLRDWIIEECHSWNIYDKVWAVVVDTPSNFHTDSITDWIIDDSSGNEETYAVVTFTTFVQAAIKLTGWEELPCFANTLNNLIKDSCKMLASIKEKVKSIVMLFQKGGVYHDEFVKNQDTFDSNYKLVIEDSIRWNSTYDMFDCFVYLRKSIELTLQILDYPKPNLTLDDWTLLEDYCEFLRPFRQITEEMAAEKYLSISKVIPLVNLLTKALDNTIENLKYSDAVTLGNCLMENFKNKFQNIERNDSYAIATLLDPRFKRIAFSDHESRKFMEERLFELAQNVNFEQFNVKSDSYGDKTFSSSLWDEFDRQVEETPKTAESESLTELQKFFQEPNIVRRLDPLEWWKDRSKSFPRLSQIAQRILSCPATSITPDRVFSKSGRNEIEKRKNLKDDTLDMLVFLHENDHNSIMFRKKL